MVIGETFSYPESCCFQASSAQTEETQRLNSAILLLITASTKTGSGHKPETFAWASGSLKLVYLGIFRTLFFIRIGLVL